MAWEENERHTEQSQWISFDWFILVRDVCKRWYLVLTVALIAGMVAYVISDLSYVPKYTTTTTFVVSKQDSASSVYQNLSATTDLATVFSEVLNSSLLRSAVLEQVGLESFNGSIQAGVVPETNLLTLQVTDSNPRTAFLVTQAILDNHQIVSHLVMGDTVMEVLQEPKVPSYPANVSMAMYNLKRVTLLVAATMCVLLGAKSYFKDTVRSRTEAKEKLDCRWLGEIYHERKYKTLVAMLRRKKNSILITNPATSFGYVETFRKLCRKVERYMPKDGGVLMVTSVLENEGKSTMAVNLALSMARRGKRVLLMDGDLRKPACHKILDIKVHKPSGVDVIMGIAPLDDAVVSNVQSGLDVLPESRAVMASGDIIGEAGMERLLTIARRKYDYVIVDTPPMSAATDAECLAGLTDGALMVVRQNRATADAVNQAVAALHDTGSRVIGCVLSDVYTSKLSVGGDNYGYGYYYGYGKRNISGRREDS